MQRRPKPQRRERKPSENTDDAAAIPDDSPTRRHYPRPKAKKQSADQFFERELERQGDE